LEADLAASAVRTAGALLLILGVIFCLFYLLKRARFGGASAAGASRMRLLSSLSIAPKRSIALVEIRDEWLVVGVGTDSVTLLTRMDRPEEASPVEMSGGGAHPSFRSLLGGLTGRPSRQEE
jgi:flagellar protein FliO/FliZ